MIDLPVFPATAGFWKPRLQRLGLVAQVLGFLPMSPVAPPTLDEAVSVFVSEVMLVTSLFLILKC